jgi:hypothetical protein
VSFPEKFADLECLPRLNVEQSIEDELEDELLADENVTPIERVYGFRENDALINRQVIV